MTQFWVSDIIPPIYRTCYSLAPVFFLQRVLWADCVRILDTVILQRPIHRPPSTRHRSVRPVCVGKNSGSLPSVVHPWSKECLFHTDGFLDVGRKCPVPQFGTSLSSLVRYRLTPGQILFGFSIIMFWGDLKSADGRDSGHWFWGTTLYLAVLLTVLGKAALISE